MVPAEIAFLPCLISLALPMGALIGVCQWRKKQRRKGTICHTSWSCSTTALQAGHTILAVVDRHTSMHFYVGHEEEESADKA